MWFSQRHLYIQESYHIAGLKKMRLLRRAWRKAKILDKKRLKEPNQEQACSVGRYRSRNEKEKSPSVLLLEEYEEKYEESQEIYQKPCRGLRQKPIWMT